MLFRPPLARLLRQAISVFICYSLLQVLLAPFALARGKRFSLVPGRPQENGVAVTGVPEGVFPNLDEVRNQQLPQPIAPPSVPSTMRSRLNPLAPRTVMHVGDPLPSPSPLTTPLPSPSIFPSPSIPPLPLVLAGLGVGSGAARWTKSPNGEGLLQFLLAWNHSYPTLYQS